MDKAIEFLSNNGGVLTILGILIALPYILSSYIQIDKIYLEPIFYMGGVSIFLGAIGQTIYFSKTMDGDSLAGKISKFISRAFIGFFIVGFVFINVLLFKSIINLLSIL